jgi:hypothetical protein
VISVQRPWQKKPALTPAIGGPERQEIRLQDIGLKEDNRARALPFRQFRNPFPDDGGSRLPLCEWQRLAFCLHLGPQGVLVHEARMPRFA